ncbi:hypothetical protein BU041_12965 [Staphylococcus simulans]|uniref:hypothetical protein n=1 Tax=Staphylococcus simulans TaxID=1286 RepID=UPI000E6827C9|nr:hypothetical protein [Staphylococcus simulans]RIN46479.1 hypothetical protein BU041_12965 [Staphylococcus simulans]
MSNNNFKDDFERNRQSIDPKPSHKKPDHLDESVDTETNHQEEPIKEKQEQHFPPRNAHKRRQRRRATATHQREEKTEKPNDLHSQEEEPTKKESKGHISETVKGQQNGKKKAAGTAAGSVGGGIIGKDLEKNHEKASESKDDKKDKDIKQ